MAVIHLAAWAEAGHPAVAVHSRSAERGQQLARAWGARHLPVEELLAETDVVVVCGSTPTHAADATLALRAGRHVLLEKPMARHGGDVRALVDLDRDDGQVFAVGHQLRFVPHVAEAIAAARDHDVATLRFRRLTAGPYWSRGGWFADPAASGGVILDMMIHDLDLALAIAGPARRVTARTVGRPERQRAYAHVEHHSGVVSELHASWAEEPGTSFLRADVVTRSGESSFRQAPTALLVVEDDRIVGDRAGLAPFVAQARDVAAAAEEGRPPTVRARDAARAGLLALAALESAESGEPVTIPE